MPIFSLKSSFKIGISRAFLNRVTVAFFIVSLLGSIFQIAMISCSLANDIGAASQIASILPNKDRAIFTSFVWNVPAPSGKSGSIRACNNTSIINPADPQNCDFTVVSPNSNLSEAECQDALLYPYQTLLLMEREEVVSIGLNAWMLFIGAYAVMAESIPHTIALCIGKTLSAAWSIFLLFRNPRLKSEFDLIASGCEQQVNGAVVISQTYWQGTYIIDFASSILSLVVLIYIFIVSWRLVRIYSSQTFTRVGAPLEIISKYKIVLAMNAATQLGLFFFLASGALWLDRLISGHASESVSHPVIYKNLFWISVFVIPFWSTLGWYSIRRESRPLVVLYLFISLLFIGSWSAMFDSTIYLYEFLNWAFWAAVTFCSMLLLTTTFVLSCICWSNFGKGISHWLLVNRVLSDSDFPPSRFASSHTLPSAAHSDTSFHSYGVSGPLRESDVSMRRVPMDLSHESVYAHDETGKEEFLEDSYGLDPLKSEAVV